MVRASMQVTGSARVRARLWAALLGSLSLASAQANAETRGYVVTAFIVANNSADFKAQCPEDRNGAQTKWLIRDLIASGFSEPEAIKVIE